MSDALVHIVDDDEATRASLSFLLASYGLRPRAHRSATSLLDELPRLDPGCVVTDVRMPDVSGIDVLKAVRKRRPDLPVIVMTGHGDIALAVEAMKLGASDFLEKPYLDGAMLHAIEAALGAGRDGPRSVDQAAAAARLGLLSQRERQVLDGVVAGKSNKVIGRDLSISPRTVEVYRANLMAKMQAGSLSELVRLALVADPDAF